MLIRQAHSSDKLKALEFCKDTFSWGDYVQYTWNSWIKEGRLLVIEDSDEILGFCHSVFFPSYNFSWIEGIRIRPRYRRRGLATTLIKTMEEYTMKKGGQSCFMLIDDSNHSSASLVSKLSYSKIGTWTFYKLYTRPNSSTGVFYIKNSQDLSKKIMEKNFFVKSWRWFPLNQTPINDLIEKQQLLGTNAGDSLAVLQKSEHFEKTMLVTIISESKASTKKILDYIQNFGFQNDYERIQVLSKSNLPRISSLEPKNNFSLFEKIL
ncbi:MAG: GNAT family N-acetyltransferase [Nitrosopumilaceae archaeon]|nr:GNAT family N-acetyltransferase [Nitrosopumilaceae archaeon]NIU00492.1 GNAT family N-acetyltransferase [Nitrosopumilaceae archaeon]NIU86875.1 GNAT family N-acetyltransferase [Nitrosopumilaceae archaeon]NIV65555.1 GNAT family N-acetyltransferase [Nitrosopumilaceae archaeon]NIX61094.1 GNAT family N-acetyltransferase [Nitrosopumilaceae archaeon]